MRLPADAGVGTGAVIVGNTYCCRGCGQASPRPLGYDQLCISCRAGRLGQALAYFPTHAEAELLADFDAESVRRLRHLRRRVRSGRLTDG
jgi:hypothetical protein